MEEVLRGCCPAGGGPEGTQPLRDSSRRQAGAEALGVGRGERARVRARGEAAAGRPVPLLLTLPRRGAGRWGTAAASFTPSFARIRFSAGEGFVFCAPSV